MQTSSVDSTGAAAGDLVVVIVLDGGTAGDARLARSLVGQTGSLEGISVVAVVTEGSADASAPVLEMLRGGPLPCVVVEASAGPLAARNAALDALAEREAAAGWVIFPDCQDEFAPEALAALRSAVSRSTAAAALVRPGKVHASGVVGDPSREIGPFAAQSDLVDLEVRAEPVASSLRRVALRTDVTGELRFDERLAAGFADQAFFVRYMLAARDRTITLVRGAAQVRSSRVTVPDLRARFAQPAAFTTVLREGHLATLAAAAGTSGAAPVWVQQLVLHDLSLYLVSDESLSPNMNAEMHHVADEFHGLVEQIVAATDDHVLDSLEPKTFTLDRRIALRRGYRGERWSESPVVLEAIDRRRHLVRLAYRYTGEAPVEELLLDGVVGMPVHAKTRVVVYAGRVLLRERIVWVSSESAIVVRLDGRDVPVSRARAPFTRTVWEPAATQRAFAGSRQPRRDVAVGDVLRRLLTPGWWGARLVRTLARTGPARRRYGGSWVLIDRVDAAHDNAEHLFKHLLRERPDVRAWFALERGSADWKRLKSEGTKSLLAYGSVRWKLVCMNASHVVSSQAGPYVYNPAALRPVGTPSWRFVFLQHGVIATDLSRWLNRRAFDLFLTSTYDEFASIAGEGSMYRFTTREIALTGLPRHDRLFRLDREATPGTRRRILVLPTWREYLLGRLRPDGTRELLDDFATTRYATAWHELLADPRLRELARQHDASIAFMPHPNIQPYLDQLDLPADVEVLTYGGNDIQEVLVSAQVVVTDLSSIVFDAAYIGRPVVYYQFDRDEVFGGSHTVRQGYFSYTDDGFGPVVTTLDAAIESVAEIAASGFVGSEEHRARMEAAFPARDEHSCERVILAIERIDVVEPPGTHVTAPDARPNRPTPVA
ncbi:CDP-glycerol glycerophosphotransferase family protein [Sanguibacter sp. HDW7]|uniref:bifunctional glycosyltransferase/CDP-glycerol:glycerophosphate glycerophosphotransferase n=1 Tax=Sanguibacter sp. HDW7 TaxID=2714931 RepID=UPI001F0DDE91|nr:CDP-glycerol glycerophosphotransferase family protein [Sanguibacter sp. HDW7]